MKKIITVLVAVFAFAAVVSAQPRALGIRAGWGGEVSYQHTFGYDSFAEFDLGWTTGSLNVAAAYDFSVAELGPFNVYAGPAADAWIVDGGGLGLGVGAQVGLEYVFDFPLQISLDWRPLFNFVPETAFGWKGIALGIRYFFD